MVQYIHRLNRNTEQRQSSTGIIRKCRHARFVHISRKELIYLIQGMSLLLMACNMDYFISDDIQYTTVGVLENICNGSRALESFYKSILQLECCLVDTEFVIQLLNLKELLHQKNFCVSTSCMLNEEKCCFHKYEVNFMYILKIFFYITFIILIFLLDFIRLPV